MSQRGRNGKTLAVITARGGSKRIPRKNIRPFVGHPIIKFSIEAALTADLFDEVIVSTDDHEIASVSRAFGAKVPFMRSPKNSDDNATTVEVLLEVLEQFQKLGHDFEYICCIYPTAPFVTAAKLRSAFSLLHESQADAVLPIVRFSYPIQRSLKLVDNRIMMNWPENYNMRSQDLLPTYHDAGQFYLMKCASLCEQKMLYAKNTAPIIVSELEVQDIDTEEDWLLAELKFKYLKSVNRL